MTHPAITVVTALCARCGATKPVTGDRVPRGWKRVDAARTLWCGTCVGATYLRRAVTVPIAEPVDATWEEFGAALREAWTLTTSCANWIVSELYARDVRREPADAKLRPMPAVYLYPEARAKFPRLTPVNLTALLQAVEQTYRKQRYELLWLGSRTLATHRYPVPTPIHQQQWELEPEAEGNGAVIVRLRLGDRWWRLRLRRGREFALQGRQLAQLRTGVAIPGAGAILRTRGSRGDHRHREQGARVLLKLTGLFPRPTTTDTNVLVVRTAISDLLVLDAPEAAEIAIHGDELRRVIRAYTVRRQRDRIGPRTVEKQSRRLKTRCQQIAAEVVRQARRHQCGVVEYEDTEQGFVAPFPWTKFRLWLQSAVEGAGLRWVYEDASDERDADEAGGARTALSRAGATA